MKLKYATLGKPVGSGGRGKKSNPDKWKTGPDLLTREKYYAYLKHRAQAAYRQEDHDLTWDIWQSLWTNETWEQRGKQAHNLILGRVDWDRGWHDDNVEIMTRKRHFEIRKQYNARS